MRDATRKERAGAGRGVGWALVGVLGLAGTAGCGGDTPGGGDSAGGSAGAAGAGASGGQAGVTLASDPCQSALHEREGDSAPSFQAVDRPGDIVWVQTPAITHDKDYFSYGPHVQPGVPTDWTSPRSVVEGQLWLHVEVLETPPGFEPPVYYTVTWQPGQEGAIQGFLRAAVEIDRAGPATYDAVADVRAIEYSPDGSCCQQVCDRPWPWREAWRDIAGDVVVLKGEGFPLRVKTRLVLRPAP